MLLGVLGVLVVFGSQPDGGGLLIVVVLMALLVCGAVWFAAGIIQVVLRRSDRRVMRSRWFLLAPALVVPVMVLQVAGVPLDARWRASRPAFEHVADQAVPGWSPEEARPLEHDGRLGLYSVSRVYQQGDAVIFARAPPASSARPGSPTCRRVRFPNWTLAASRPSSSPRSAAVGTRGSPACERRSRRPISGCQQNRR